MRYYVDGAGAMLTPVAPPQGPAMFVRKLHAPAWWKMGRTGAGQKTGIIDTGAALDKQPNLAARVVASHSFVPVETVDDGHGHGTHVAGCVAQVAPGAPLVIAKGLNNAGWGEDTWLAAAVRWCHAVGCRIINASWGSAEEPTGPAGEELRRAIQDFVADGGLFVTSAGNSGHEVLQINTVTWPARWPEPLAVAATWQLVAGAAWAQPAPFSSAGPEIDVAAPGTWVVSWSHLGGWVEMSGTSMAAPLVAGMAALLAEDWEIRTGEPATDPILVPIIKFLTRDISSAGRDVLAGVGEVDLEPRVECRVVTLTEGGATVAVQDSNTLATGEVTLDVPAKIEAGRFVAEFRSLARAMGAHTIEWNGALRQGTAEVDVVQLGDPGDGRE